MANHMAPALVTIKTAARCTKASGRMATDMAKAMNTFQTAIYIKVCGCMATDMAKAPSNMQTGVVTMACGRITLDMGTVSPT